MWWYMAEEDTRYRVELSKIAEQVTSWTGIVREEAFKIARLAMEYRKPKHGVWGNNT